MALSAYIPLRYRGLVWQMARREFELRYRGSVMGLAWSFLNPLIMLAVYTFVFREVFKARWGVEGATGGRICSALALNSSERGLSLDLSAGIGGVSCSGRCGLGT